MIGETDFSDELPPDDPPPPESFETARPVAPAVRTPSMSLSKPALSLSKPTLAAQEPRHESRIVPRSSAAGRTLPHSLEAEEYLLSCCLLDGSDTIARCLESHISGSYFYSSANSLLFRKLCELHQKNTQVELAVLAQELKTSGELESVGGYAYLTKITASIPTTAQSVYFIEKIKELHVLRESIKAATTTIEQAFQFSGGIDEFLSDSRARIDRIGLNGKNGIGRSAMDFTVPLKGDRSILLGDRYLNRGDGGVIVSTSGMGKSSMSLQAAACWALGRDFFGIKPNGPLKSIVVQSEDSEGDIGEVMASISHAMKLAPADIDQVKDKVIIHTERVARGAQFMAVLRRLISKHKPDLVWVNPLQAFMDGDVTQGKDLSAFLRAGLNQLNEPPTFGYIIVHHTTKPATGKERADRLWHEVMYDMAGGAEIINWARFIISLRAAANEGEFNLHLAKRGRRAGVVKVVNQGAGFHSEPVTKIPLRHSQDRMTLPGHTDSIPVVFWEGREADVEPDKPDGEKHRGAPEKYPWSDFNSIFPKKNEDGIKLAELHRKAVQNVPISSKMMHNVLKRFTDDGQIECIDTGGPKRYRLAI